MKVELFPFVDSSRSVIAALSTSVLATLYATDGWMNVTNIAGEMKNPGKDLPKAIIGGISVVTLVYLAINVAYLHVMPATAIAGTTTPASDVAYVLFPSFGGKLITVGILISVFGSQTGFVRASWRVPYALALRNLLPCSERFSKLNKRTEMPVNSGMLIMVITLAVLVLIGDFNTLSDIGSFVIWFFYILAFAGIFILRKKWPDKERPYKVPLYPFVPIMGAAGGIFVLGSTILYQPFIAGVSVLAMLSGVPVYIYLKKRDSKN